MGKASFGYGCRLFLMITNAWKAGRGEGIFERLRAKGNDFAMLYFQEIYGTGIK